DPALPRSSSHVPPPDAYRPVTAECRKPCTGMCEILLDEVMACGHPNDRDVGACLVQQRCQTLALQRGDDWIETAVAQKNRRARQGGPFVGNEWDHGPKQHRPVEHARPEEQHARCDIGAIGKPTAITRLASN